MVTVTAKAFAVMVLVRVLAGPGSLPLLAVSQVAVNAVCARRLLLVTYMMLSDA